jgi:hypothetical protein
MNFSVFFISPASERRRTTIKEEGERTRRKLKD